MMEEQQQLCCKTCGITKAEYAAGGQRQLQGWLDAWYCGEHNPAFQRSLADLKKAGLTWRKETPTNLRSACGRYSVARITMAGVVSYEAWCKECSIQLSVGMLTADAAKSVCEQHAAA